MIAYVLGLEIEHVVPTNITQSQNMICSLSVLSNITKLFGVKI